MNGVFLLAAEPVASARERRRQKSVIESIPARVCSSGCHLARLYNKNEEQTPSPVRLLSIVRVLVRRLHSTGLRKTHLRIDGAWANR